jgi:error-prone DNA polymerase
MAAWRRPGLIEQFRRKLLAGMQANNLPKEFAQRVYQQIEGFGEYGFPESHAASFALLVYASAWLKHYYPAAFAAAMINSQPMGFYQPAQLVRDAREHGVAVRPVDVNWSGWECTLEQGAGSREQEADDFGFRISDCGLEEVARSEERGSRIENEVGDKTEEEHSTVSRASRLDPHPFLRLGFRMLSGMREAVAKVIEQTRAAGPFVSIDDFTRRTGVGRAVVKQLAEADVFRSVGAGRRQALWQALGQEKKRREMPLFENIADPFRVGRIETLNVGQDDRMVLPTAGQDGRAILEPTLPAMEPYEEVVADYRTAGLSLRAHPISFYRKQLTKLGVTPARNLAELANEEPVIVAGLVLLRQRPGTAKGITFVTLEDETGTVNLVVHQQTWDRFYRSACRAPAWIAHGHIQNAPGQFAAVIHVVVKQLEALGEQLRQLDVKARDFR